MGKVAKYSHFRPHTTVHHPLPRPTRYPRQPYHPRYRQYPFHVLTSFSLDLIELVIKGHDHASFCSIISIYRGNRTSSRKPNWISDRSTGLIVKNEYGDGGWKRKADAECFPFDDGSCETISFYAWNFFLFLLACFFRFANVTNKM